MPGHTVFIIFSLVLASFVPVSAGIVHMNMGHISETSLDTAKKIH